MLTVRRNIRVIDIYFIFNFNNLRRFSKVHISQVPADVISERKLCIIRTCKLSQFRRLDQRRNRSRHGASVIRKPRCIRDFTTHQAEPDVITLCRTQDRISISPAIQIHRRRGAQVATALHHARTNGIAINRAHKIGYCRIPKSGIAVIHKFEHVPRHVADIPCILGSTYLMRCRARVSPIPALFRFPVFRCNKNPFRFGRQSKAFLLRIELVTFHLDTMLFGIKFGTRIIICRIKPMFFAQGICIQDGIVKRHVCSRQRILFARELHTRFFAHQVIEVSTDNFVATDIKIIGKLSSHFRTFQRFGRNVIRPKRRLFALSLHIDKAVDVQFVLLRRHRIIVP